MPSYMLLLVLPVTLFPPPPETTSIVVIEHPYYFNRLPFHKAKLVLHRASLKAYASTHGAAYVEAAAFKDFPKGDVATWDPLDHEVRRELLAAGVKLMDNPGFPSISLAGLGEGFKHAAFYREQRRHLGIGLTADGKPRGGRWSFDTENRLPFPPAYKEPRRVKSRSPWVVEARRYVKKRFPDNFGSAEAFWLPVTHAAAASYLRRWVDSHLKDFGPYQDAVSPDVAIGEHSTLAPLLNVGLLTVPQVLEAIKGKRWTASVEGFVRQLIGWRSYMRVMYDRHRGELLKANTFDNRGRLSKGWFSEGEVGVLPVDHLVDKAWDLGYLHHIERLMYVGAFMLMSGISPKEAYRWFMIATFDSYDWVMVPNVYGMLYYGAGLMTRPYFSSSQYLRRMSAFPKGDWVEQWDEVFHGFVGRHRRLLQHNYATARFVPKN